MRTWQTSDRLLRGMTASLPTYAKSTALPSTVMVPLAAALCSTTWVSVATAAVWYNKDYGNELTFGADYGAYTDCDATGLAKPGDKVVDVLTWAFYRSFQEAINEGNSSLLRYSTADNSTLCAAEIRNYTGNTYDLGNFQAVSDPASIKYTDGQVIYNGHFVANYTDSGSSYTADHHRTLRLVWEDGIWKVDAFSLLPDGAYSATTYAPLP